MHHKHWNSPVTTSQHWTKCQDCCCSPSVGAWAVGFRAALVNNLFFQLAQLHHRTGVGVDLHIGPADANLNLGAKRKGLKLKLFGRQTGLNNLNKWQVQPSGSTLHRLIGLVSSSHHEAKPLQVPLPPSPKHSPGLFVRSFAQYQCIELF